MKKEAFGYTKNGQEVDKYTIQSPGGLSTSILTYGAILQSFLLPSGRDVVLGHDTMEDYERQDKYLGAVVGRVANRIGGGRFTLNGKDYVLCQNNGPNHLHGGLVGFDKKVWQAKTEGETLVLSCESADGEEGYPGKMDVTVRYWFSEDDTLWIDYTAKSDADTLVNLTNHTYFNLEGHGAGSILNHTLWMDSDAFTENDEFSCPTGRILPVEGTAMDFRRPKPLGQDIDRNEEQIRRGNGYDHNFVLRNPSLTEPFAKAQSGGVTLTAFTTQPGAQLYTGNFLDGVVAGKGGACYEKRSGFCLETQGFPDAIHHPHFPSPVLKAGEGYHQKTGYRLTEESQA